jgi:Family of unknown function (DUF6353)
LKGGYVMLRELFKEKVLGANPTTILTGMGVTGVVTTAYLASRASFKAAQIIEKENRKKQPDNKYDTVDLLSNKEKFKLVWPEYVAPISVGATTITAIIMSNHSASKRIAALTVASGISERALTEYKAKVLEKIGENKEMAIRDEIAQERVAATPTSKEVLVIGAGDVLCFDILTGRYFLSTVEKIRQAENKINYEILNHMYASLSMFYDLLDIPPTPYSDTVGWNGLTDRFEVQFSTVMSPDNRPCIAIDFAHLPIAEYTKLY